MVASIRGATEGTAPTAAIIVLVDGKEVANAASVDVAVDSTADFVEVSSTAAASLAVALASFD